MTTKLSNKRILRVCFVDVSSEMQNVNMRNDDALVYAQARGESMENAYDIIQPLYMAQK